MRVTFRFRDCATTGDSCYCAQDITDSGGRVIDPVSTDHENRIAEIIFDVDNHVTFLASFRRKPSYQKLIKP